MMGWSLDEGGYNNGGLGVLVVQETNADSIAFRRGGWD